MGRVSGHWKGLALALLGAGLILGTASFFYAREHGYLGDDPKACVQCHVMQPFHDSWEKSSHGKEATCNDCHLPQGTAFKWLTKAGIGASHLVAFKLDLVPDPIKLWNSHKSTVEGNCLRCHKAPKCNASSCLRCHDGVTHRPPEKH